MMIRYSSLWRVVGLAVCAALPLACGSTPPVAETPPPTVTVSQPLVREVTDHDDYEGRIAAIPTAEVRSRVRGHLMKINFQEGQIVKEGELLFEIDPRPYKAALDAAEALKAAAEGNLKLAKAEYNRTLTLVGKGGAASQQELDFWTAKQAVAVAEGQKADAGIKQAKLDLDFTRITALITGKIGRAQVDVGNLVNAGGGETLLATITAVDPIYVYFDVPERALRRYRDHFRKRGEVASVKDLKIPVYVGVEGEDGYPHKGLIDFADNRINPGTGTIQVRGNLPNADRLLDAGMRARVRVPVSDPHKSILIAERAIGTDQGLKFVYVVAGDNIVERRDVKLGRLHDGLYVVQEGVKPDDWVVVNGIQRVRDGVKVDPRQSPMPGAQAGNVDPNTKN